MQDQRDPPQLGHRSGRLRRSGLLTRILAVAGGALVLIGAIAISIVVFAVVLVVVLLFGLYLWWKTRNVRKQVREQMKAREPMHAPRAEGSVIEGEVIRKDESRTPP
jgi:O-antigen/teichoic acid export membrane protein